MGSTTNKHQLRSDRTYQTILDVAFRLFLSVGIERTSITQIADRAGVHRSTVYRYFDSRDDIGYAIREQIVDQTTVRATTPASKTGTGWDRLAGFMRSSNDLVRADRDSVRFFTLFDAHTAVLDDQAKRVEPLSSVFRVEESFAMLVSLIRDGIDDRSIRGDIDARRVAASLWLSFSTIWCQIVIQDEVLQTQLGIEDAEAIAHDTIEILLDGLKAQ